MTRWKLIDSSDMGYKLFEDLFMKAAPKFKLPELKFAALESSSRVVLIFVSPLEKIPDLSLFSVSHNQKFTSLYREGFSRLVLEGGPFEIHKLYRITFPDGNSYALLPFPWLDRIVTEKPLGLIWEKGGATVRFFSPRSQCVELLIFKKPEDEPFLTLSMNHDLHDGVWEVGTDKIKPGHFYGLRVKGPEDASDLSKIIFADPYSLAVAKRNTFQRESLTVVLPPDLIKAPPAEHVAIPPRDLMIYEAHLKDFSKLAAVVPYSLRGAYPGAVFLKDGSPLDHLIKLGVNCIEWLPLQDYDYYEPPYNVETDGVLNTWNRYARNHWGYMPAYYFAPEARYASGFSTREGDWIGADGRQVAQFRQMVKAFHDQGIAVIMDVVYNHVAQYGQNPLRQINPMLTLRYDREGKRIDQSQCGNDLRTECPMVRRLIVDSLLHFIRFYGVDGFRFDLAGLLDGHTIDAINNAVREVYPSAMLIAEPWGGRYDKTRFSKRGWASWNDRFRDGIRGNDPRVELGFIFAQWGSRNPDHTILRQVTGNLVVDGGPFQEENHAVNYLACHDGYTFGDFIRVAVEKTQTSLKKECEKTTISPIDTGSLIRLGLMILFTSRGIVMLHQGDEWGWSKVISAEGSVSLGACDPIPDVGKLDYNSYNKDNSTNWLNWALLEKPIYKELLRYTRGLISMRKRHPALRLARREDIVPLQTNSEFAFGYRVKVSFDDLIVLFNAHLDREVTFSLPEKRWRIIADHLSASEDSETGGVRLRRTVLPPSSGMVLKRMED